jgi:tRNA (guanine10-N2)-dimethyltransferase
MKLMFELSKEQKTLPCAEIQACLHAEDIAFTVVDSNEDVFIVETKADDRTIPILAQRLGFTFMIDEFLFSCSNSLDDISRSAKTHPLVQEGSIAIRYKNRCSSMDSHQLVDVLGSWYTKNRSVNLRHPDIELRALVTETSAYIGLKKAEVDTSQYQERRAHHRPFFSPISLHPKIARALVNLASVRKNEIVLDPFCGTGGILLEAGLIGARVVGNDVEGKMIEGCKKTLEFYKINNMELMCYDIGEIPQRVTRVDAVVTDFPYGKATTTKGEHRTALYDRAFEAIFKVLKKNGKAVVGLSERPLISLGENYLSCKEVHVFRVHRSMTRFFVVYQK